MTRGIASLFFSIGIFVLAGCATAPADRSGISGSITVPDTNPAAIRRAAQPAFARYGYSISPASTAQSLVFQRSASQTGQRLLGTAAPTTNLRGRLQLLPLPRGNDFRLVIQLTQADIQRPAGTASDTQSMRLLMNQFESILREIRAGAASAGPAR